MSKKEGRHLTIVEAARIIFRTDSPTEQHIGRVYQRMKAGVIHVHDRKSAPRDWTTSERAVAEFLAGEMMRQPQQRGSRRPPHRALSATGSSGTPTMSGVYRNIWTDYFMAVMLRRRIQHRSTAFRRAVVVGQSMVLSVLLSVIVMTSRSANRSVAPERVAIEAYLRQHYDRIWITNWHATRPSGDGKSVLVEVDYRYRKDNPRVIATHRQFQYDGQSFLEIGEDDDSSLRSD